MDNSNNVIERLKVYCANNPDVVSSNIIKGINSSDNKIVIEFNGGVKNITIDELESNTWRNPSQEEVEVMEEPVEQLEVMIEQPEKQLTTIKDISDVVSIKNEMELDKALRTFAFDEKTGTISINKAIKIVTDNSINNVVNCVKNNSLLPDDPSKYDIKGNLLAGAISSNSKVDLQTLIDISFKNILVYVEAAKLKNIIYNDSQIMSAKNKYSIGIQDKLNVLGLNKKDDSDASSSNNSGTNQTSSSGVEVKDIKPDNDIKKAGFADILILTIIVITYAAIIINLITKLK